MYQFITVSFSLEKSHTCLQEPFTINCFIMMYVSLFILQLVISAKLPRHYFFFYSTVTHLILFFCQISIFTHLKELIFHLVWHTLDIFMIIISTINIVIFVNTNIVIWVVSFALRVFDALSVFLSLFYRKYSATFACSANNYSVTVVGTKLKMLIHMTSLFK